MAEDRLRQLLHLFDEAADLKTTDQHSYVEALRTRDAALADELLRMLHADRSATGAVRRVVQAGASLALKRRTAPTVGERIGPYKLLELVGEGGMGLVYRARTRVAPGQDVAVKVLRADMLDTSVVLRRFARERRLLASLDHPGICRIFDSGETDAGLPYFVMEYLQAQPIDEYCASTTASLQRRVALVGQVCRIVEHAHARGVLHRDLKPSNLLIAMHRSRARPVVIDFGIARSLDADASGEQLTRIGHQLGTPSYMSPEQKLGLTDSLDRRSDIYTLGVVLFELLTGTLPPFDPRPSAVINTLGARAESVATERATDPAQLQQTLRERLDRVVVRAIEEDRRYRYATVAEFADDLDACLPQL